MSRRVLIAVLVVIAVALAAAIPYAIRYSKQQEAEIAVRAYNVALAESLRKLNPERLEGTVTPREKGRIAAYITSLWGRQVVVDGTLESLKVTYYRSAEPTITVHTKERWTYVERDMTSMKQVGDVMEEQNELEYTLVRTNGKLLVELAEQGESGSQVIKEK